MSPRVLLGFAGATATLAALPLLQRVLDFPPYYLVFMYFLFFWITQATSWNLLSGYAGYFSFGQSAFFGAGVYTSAVLMSKFGVNLLAALPVAGLVAAMVGVAMGMVAFRLRRLKEAIFALLTLAVALGMHSFVNNNAYIDGGRGISLNRASYPLLFGSMTHLLYYLGLVIAAFTLLIAYWILMSKLGRGLTAIRDDEPVAEQLGVPTFRYKMVAVMISAALAGVSGGVHALQLNYVMSDSVFTLRLPLFVIIMAILGGQDYWFGPALGAVLVHTINDRLTSAGLEEFNQILAGAIVMIVAVYLPHGLAARFIQRLWPCLATVGGLVVAQSLFIPTRSLLDSLATAMAVALLLLLLPSRLWAGLAHLFRPARVVSLLEHPRQG